MNAEKIITTTEPVDIDIQGITLLSVEEAKQLPRKVLAASDSWWLRSPSHYSNRAAVVGSDGRVFGDGSTVYDDLGVRPALIIKNLKSTNLANGDKINYRGYTWTVILGKYALCDSIINKQPYREDWRVENANDYEASDIKKYIEDWLGEVEDDDFS